jgi:hypothetical protein
MKEYPADFTPIGREDLNLGIDRPAVMPAVPKGRHLVCEFVRMPGAPDFNFYYPCESFADMQWVYDAYLAGGACEIHWFLCDAVTAGTN